MRTGEALALEGLSFSYGNTPVLTDAHCQVKAGAFVAIVGPNGGGKTTLLKLAMGFLEPTAGAIRVCGKPPVEARKEIGYVPQHHKSDRLFPITVEELVLLGALKQRTFSTTGGWTFSEPVKARAEELLERLGIAHLSGSPFHSLSGGQMQRALLARALVSDPSLLLLDEPTSHLDPPSAEALFDALEALKGTKTILIVTHEVKTAVERVDQVLCIQRTIRTLEPRAVCNHFALGLYHEAPSDLVEA